MQVESCQFPAGILPCATTVAAQPRCMRTASRHALIRGIVLSTVVAHGQTSIGTGTANIPLLFAPPPASAARRRCPRHYKLPAVLDQHSMVAWEEMWRRDGGLKPGSYFDAAGSSKVLLQVLADMRPAPGATALVPGCGRGYDVIEMAKVGFDALGLDIAETAVAAASAHNEASLQASGQKAWSGKVRFSTQDFFALEPPEDGFDLIYDYTFLCALDPSQRVDWAQTMRRLIKQRGGELITLIFPLGDYEGGPPHAMSKELVSRLLTAQGFEATYLEPVNPALSHHGRGGKEMLGRWRLAG